MNRTKVQDYFTLLGVTEDVSQEALEARYRDLADHLSSSAIPAALQGWARQQAALVDEAYAVLSDPERREEAREEESAKADTPSRSGTEDKRRSRQGRRARSAQTQLQEGPPGEAKRRGERAGPGSPPAGPFVGAALSRSRPLLLGIVIGMALVGAVLLGRYGFGGNGDGDGSTIEEHAEAGDAVPLDTERVSELMAVVKENPDDAFALFELGERFFQANQWEAAITWFTRVVELDPENVHAMTDIGTANYELGRMDIAEQTWLAALEIAPDDVQLHYNLGFLYANEDPPDFVAAKREWERVVQLEPDSDLAQTVQVHLDSLEAETGAGEAVQATPASGSGAGPTPTPSETGRSP